MNDRERIFKNLQQALHPLTQRTPYPQWQDDLAVCRAHPEGADPWQLFALKMKQVNGIALDGLDALGTWMRGQKLDRGFCDPACLPSLQAHPAFADIQWMHPFERKRIDDYTFGITRASAIIAETGTLILKDSETASRLAALAPWTHIALVEPDGIYNHCAEALRNLGDDPATVWITGPSKTADIEGILIEGVHGPGIQVCCRVPGGTLNNPQG